MEIDHARRRAPGDSRREVWRSLADSGQSERRRTWTYYDVPLLEDLAELRDVLWRKYQRKRLPHEDIETIERIIKERGGTLEPLD
jgi:hypothetical protein